MSLTRYELYRYQHDAEMEPQADGEYVRFEDAEADKASAVASLHRQYAELLKAARFVLEKGGAVPALAILESAVEALPGDETP